MNEKLRNHPLNGIGLDALLGDLVREYGWDVLAEQLPISCFTNYPSFKSSVKFLKRTEWARERLEDLYIYKFLQYPLPQGDQQSLPPRNRIIEDARNSDAPAVIELGEAEFFATPAARTGEKSNAGSRRSFEGMSYSDRARTGRSSEQPTSDDRSAGEDGPDSATASDSPSNETGGKPDPWAKWRK